MENLFNSVIQIHVICITQVTKGCQFIWFTFVMSLVTLHM